jgi:hypothetical protein
MIKRPQSIVPEVLKALRRKFRVPDGMLNIALPQVVLNGACISVLVGQVKAAGVPQHMRMDRKGQGAASPARLTMWGIVRPVSGAARSERNTYAPPGCAVLSRRKARSSGACRGCTDDTPCLRRRTWSNAACTSMCSQRKRLTSATRNPCRYISKISVASRSPCRPTLQAAPIRRCTSAGVKYSRHADPYASVSWTAPLPKMMAGASRLLL